MEVWGTKVLSILWGFSEGDLHIRLGRVGWGWLKMQVPGLHVRPAKSESLRLVLGLTFELSSLGDWILWLWCVAVIFGLFSSVLNSNTEIWEALSCTGGSESPQILEHSSHIQPCQSLLLAKENRENIKVNKNCSSVLQSSSKLQHWVKNLTALILKNWKIQTHWFENH